ncbi:hypothetical protein HMPREF0650_0458 [Hoylesella buccalis ATCC 35310]|uniref:Uncharacterized protein n=1 Tax=Hoylesella buccalis ATCC 35310 TaxID=679190 RepID=D1W315_9BACT|nr:hypothetical protein HMPREF0650_0458 [Hoylesella buccalis ATCC 35310]
MICALTFNGHALIIMTSQQTHHRRKLADNFLQAHTKRL